MTKKNETEEERVRRLKTEGMFLLAGLEDDPDTAAKAVGDALDRIKERDPAAFGTGCKFFVDGFCEVLSAVGASDGLVGFVREKLEGMGIKG